MRLEKESAHRIHGPLTLGETVSYRNGHYRPLDLLKHTTRYGPNTQLLKWEGDFGQKFTFETTKNKFSPLARCKPHR